MAGSHGVDCQCPDCNPLDYRRVTSTEIVDLQVTAMRALVANMRASLGTYLEAVAKSPEIQERLAKDLPRELGSVFDLIAHRALAIVASAEKSVDGPETEQKEPS
jgi:hypothetical protein